MRRHAVQGINSLELAMEAVKTIQDRFYEDFPARKEEEEYAFATPSTMKPTQWDCHKNGLNQICPYCTVSGDIRVTPFYDNAKIKAAVEGCVLPGGRRIPSPPPLSLRSPCHVPALSPPTAPQLRR